MNSDTKPRKTDDAVVAFSGFVYRDPSGNEHEFPFEMSAPKGHWTTGKSMIMQHMLASLTDVVMSIPDDVADQLNAPWITPEGRVAYVFHSTGGAGSGLRSALWARHHRALEEMYVQMTDREVLEAVASPTDFVALARAIASASVTEQATKEDPLSGAAARAVQQRDLILERAGPFLNAETVSKLLRIERQSIDKRRNRGLILGIKIASNWLYPKSQFIDGQVVPRLGDVLKAHKGDALLYILDALTAPSEALGDVSMMDKLREGDNEAIDRYIAQVTGDGFS